MRETTFQWEMHAAITHHYPNAHYHKIQDPARMASHNPYDAYFFMDRNFWALEYKQMKKVEAFPFAKIEDHQVFNLRKVMMNGGFAYFLINYRANVTEEQRELYGIGEKKINVVFVVGIKETLEAMTRGEKSFPVKWLLDNCMILNRETIEKGLTLWSVRDLIERDVGGIK